MIVFGVELKHPTPVELGLTVVVIISFLAINWLAEGTIEGAFPSLAAVSAGALAASFGLSPLKGWRQAILFLIVGSIAYAIVVAITQ